MAEPVFLYPPNWASAVSERLEWLTDVIESHDATEERTQLRNKPRRYISYQMLTRLDAAQELDAWLWRYHATQFLLPIWTDPQRLAAQLAQASTSIPATTDGYDFAAGQWAVLINGDLHEAVQIDQVNADSLDLVDQTLLTWPAGTLLYPARYARLPADADLDRITAGVLTSGLEFEIEPGSGTAIESTDTYRSLPVLTDRPDWATGIAQAYARKIQRIDYQLGDVYVDDLSERPITMRTHRYVQQTREQIKQWRGWLHARAGRANSFWLPQWQMDLRQTAAIGAADTQLQVYALSYDARYAAEPGRRDIALLHKTGTWYFRRIESVTTSGEDEILTLDSALGIDASPGDFKLITWLMPSRLDTDDIILNWLSSGVATSAVDIRSLRSE